MDDWLNILGGSLLKVLILCVVAAAVVFGAIGYVVSQVGG